MVSCHDAGQEFAVKVRAAGEKRFRFLTPRLTTTGRWVHAGRFAEQEKAAEVGDELISANEQLEAAVVVDAATSRVVHRCDRPGSESVQAASGHVAGEAEFAG